MLPVCHAVESLPLCPCGTVRGLIKQPKFHPSAWKRAARGARASTAQFRELSKEYPFSPIRSPASGVRLIHPVFNVLRSRRNPHNYPWKEKKREKIGIRARRMKPSALRSESTQNGASDILRCSDRMSLNGRSFQDALRTFFQPIKNDDARLDFYTMYKREATEYDTDYVKKYDEDLNTTLIFVSRMPFGPVIYLTFPCRPAFSLPSVPPSSSMSTRGYSPIRTSNLQLSSARSSSPSINLLSRTKPPTFHPSQKTLPPRSSLSLG